MNDYRGSKLIIGLGNPGRLYHNTYHNVGFLGIDRIAAEHAPANLRFHHAELFDYLKLGDRILVKPRTFMNQSGVAVVAVLKYFSRRRARFTSRQLFVIHDDADLAFGKYRISFGRGSAGHRGVESVMAHLKTKNFWRLRVGIRKKAGQAGLFVLKKISTTDMSHLQSPFSAFITKLSENENPG